MNIGTFGDIVFETSADKVRTFDGLQRSGEARYAEHAVQGDKPRLEFLGDGLDEVTLPIRLDAALGLIPIEEIESLRRLRASGEVRALIIGGRNQGNFVLKGAEETWQTVDNEGRLWVAGVTLKLKEYA